MCAARDMPAARYVPSGREMEFISYRRRVQRVYIAIERSEIISHFAKQNISQKGFWVLDKKTIRELAIELTVEIVEICDAIKGRSVFINQLYRSCSSIGANSHEAKYAQSDADFINKMEIALKESYETEYWLEILNKIKAIDDGTYKDLRSKCGTIRRKLVASIETVKAKKQ